MKTCYLKRLLLSVCSLIVFSANAQMPVCSGTGSGWIYFVDDITGALWNLDPTQPISTTNPWNNTISTFPVGPVGLAVSENINGPGPSPTFYVVNSAGTYLYYDGSTWVNTGHSSGTNMAVNMGAGGGYIFNLNGFTGDIYRYDGTGNGVLITTVAGFNFNGPFDLAADCEGNFYILQLNQTQILRKYDPNGNLLTTWTVTGAPAAQLGGGLGIIGNMVYYDNSTGFFGGVMAGTTVNFTQLSAGIQPFPNDFGTCPLNSTGITGIHDTVNYCPGVPLNLNSSGSGPYTWTVVTGPASINGSGQSVSVSTTGDALVTVSSVATCGNVIDSFTIIAPTVTTSQDTVVNCGNIPLTITSTGLPPYAFTVINGPASIVSAGAVATVMTSATSQVVVGANTICGIMYDTITVLVPTATIDAGPDDTLFGCGTYSGTLHGTVSNTSSGITYTYAWTPAGTITSGANTLQPSVAPAANTMYLLTVSTAPGGCQWQDSVFISVSDATVVADFDTARHFGCEGDTILLTDLSVNATSYAWDFGNGSTSSAQNPLYVYTTPGTYTITLTASNPYCSATASKQVTIVHELNASFTVSKDSICNNETVNFTNTSTASSPYSYTWDFGDGSTDTSFNASHQYTADGIYNVTLSITDSIPCNSIASHDIVVASISVAVIPQDTSVCLGDSMRLYADITAPPYFSNFAYSWSPTDNIGDNIASSPNFYTETPGDNYYTVTVTGYPMQCVASDTAHIHIQPRPVLINVSPDQVVEYGSTVQLNAEGVMYYVWTPTEPLDNPNIKNPRAYMTEPTVFTVYGMNEHGGCRDTAMVKIDLTYNDEVIPSVFSPNGDGKNDVFRLLNMKEQKLAEFRIFNRWGQELYMTNDPAKGWDGTFKGMAQDVGVYHYLIRVTSPDGQMRTYKGNLTLVR